MKEYSRIELCTNDYLHEGVKKGDIGYIVEIYEKGVYGVEFSKRETGETIALLTLKEGEIKLAELEGD